MNKFIEKELEKVELDMEQVSENHFIIHKQDKAYEPFKVGEYYIIQIADYVLHPNEMFTLADNWNNGIIPQSEYMKVCVTQTMGKMIKVDGLGYEFSTETDKSDVYQGLWLPQGSIKKIKSL